jgi:hypothetical protein
MIYYQPSPKHGEVSKQTQAIGRRKGKRMIVITTIEKGATVVKRLPKSRISSREAHRSTNSLISSADKPMAPGTGSLRARAVYYYIIIIRT